MPKDAKRDCRRNYTLASAYIKATRRGKGDGRFRCARFCEKLERRLRFVSREPAIVVRVKVPIEHLGVEAAEQFDGEDLASLCEHAEARVVGRASHNRGKCGLPLRSHKRTTPGPKSQRDSHATRGPGKASKNLIARARRRLGGCTGQVQVHRTVRRLSFMFALGRLPLPISRLAVPRPLSPHHHAASRSSTLFVPPPAERHPK